MSTRYRVWRPQMVLSSLLFIFGCGSLNTDTGPKINDTPPSSSASPIKDTDPYINQLQFVGSHNSYKKAMAPQHSEALKAANPKAWASLDYSHLPLAQQLALGMRKLELDVFYQAATADFAVGHVQVIDMASHCPTLNNCLRQLVDWSTKNPRHAPIWISFNTKDQAIPGLPTPTPITAEVLVQLDQTLESALGDRLIRPSDITNLNWPTLSAARGKFLLILDEQGDKRDTYLNGWRERPMFTNSPANHPAAAVMIINDPIADGAKITELVRAGYLIRTRADADTAEARQNDTRRRDAAFASGAQAVSTDYYVPSTHFPSPYQVTLPGAKGSIRCNPINTQKNCLINE